MKNLKNYGLAELINMYDAYNETWIYCSMTELPETAEQMRSIIREDIAGNGKNYDIHSEEDFINKYFERGTYNTLEEYKKHMQDSIRL